MIACRTTWLLLASAGTDFIVTFGTSLGTAMVATGSAEMPSTAVLVISLLGALVAFGRTLQQALKSARPPT